MTFISTVIARQGIILAADSKELVQGGQLLWKDFDDLLKSKNTNEDDTTPCISPKEITEKINEHGKLTKGRIKSTDGAKKIFRVGTHSAILISGVANPSGREYSDIIKDIQDNIIASGDNSFQKSVSITFNIIETLINSETSMDKFSAEYLYCGFDEQDEKFKVFRFYFETKLKMDANGNPERDGENKIINIRYFTTEERNVLLSTSGWTAYVNGLEALNYDKLEIDLPQAFEFSKRIIDLVVSIENISNDITGIGGKIYFAVITIDGFQWVNTETDVMNLL